MRVAVVGGTGSIGAPVVAELSARGDEVRILSRNPPAASPAGATHCRIDLSTGDGLREALAGVEVVVDAANDSRRAKDVLVEGGRRLLAAERDAGVRHHVAISIVGCDRVSLGYYREKVAQEAVVAGADVPWSLLRATQFHTLMTSAFEACERVRAVPTGAARLQPVDPVIVAKRLADAVHDGPGGRLPDIAGPEVQTLVELARAWREHSDHRLVAVRLPLFGKVGRALRDGALCDPSAAAGGPTFEQWLANGRRSPGGS
jgi:uncharacterized protein YbjT (DUF2867 family)